MAYNFSVEKRGGHDLLALHHALGHFHFVEFFPIEASEELLTLGISIPLRSIDEPCLENELDKLMRFLVVEQEFNVTDLFK